MPEVLLIKTDIDKADIEQKSHWAEAFAGFDIEVRHWDSPGALGEIDYALVWHPEPGASAQ